jgi:predicted transposase/invertase (TIGR01784 family)
MRRDSIFYALFRQSPSLLFELLDNPPESAQQYRFESVAVKEPRFEIDGVFLPPESDPPGTVFFAEVQMQKDERLYERMVGESMLCFYRNRDYYSDWQAIVIYASRSIEQSNSHPYRALLNSDQVHRVYLNEIGSIENLPLGIAAMILTIAKDSEAPEKARMLIARANQEIAPLPIRQGIIEIISTIIVHKFTNLSRKEIDAMLGNSLEGTRVYQEAQEEKAQEIAIKMLQDNVSPEQISHYTGLTLTEIQTLRSQVDQQPR